MKQRYTSPELEILKLTVEDILDGSNDKIFVDTEDLFGA